MHRNEYTLQVHSTGVNCGVQNYTVFVDFSYELAYSTIIITLQLHYITVIKMI